MTHCQSTTKSPVSRSRVTNDPLALPPGLRGTSAEGRRWSDLVAAYQAQLGTRMQRENVRALVGSVVSLTLINERLNAEVARGEPVDPNHVIQTAQTVMRLLSELGLETAPRSVASDLASYLRDGEPAP